jgi:hypothetical protein
MSILTDCELACLATLTRNWERLYRNELAHLLKDTERDDRSGNEETRLDATGWLRQQARGQCCA